MMTVDDLIDAFVEKVNALAREPRWPDDVPPSLRLGPPNKYGMYDWKIQKQDGIDWVEAVEAKLSAKLPPSFRSLVTRYVYPEFKAQGLWFFANTSEQVADEWREWLFKDKALSGGLLREGYIQFARPDTGSYDPICFDTQHKTKDGECPIVWIDHEDILCKGKNCVYKEIAPSFVEFVQDYLSGR